MPSLFCHPRTKDRRFRRSIGGLALLLACGLHTAMVGHAAVDETKPYVVYEGESGPGRGKHIVLISGDEEYRSEEGLPQLAKILAKHHGFKCTVLFAVDPETGEINPNVRNNIPGLEALKTADLMIIATRFRDLPDDQMKHIADYLEAGKPVIGMRTATHAFNIRQDSAYHKYDWRYGGEEYPKGFGKQVLGETWVAHHGRHKHESTRGIVAPDAAGHPILRGIADGDIWGPTDVYTVNLPLPGDSEPVSPDELERWKTILQACWRAFDETVAMARGKALAKGPRGGGRELEKIVEHVGGATASYLTSLGGKAKPGNEDDPSKAFAPLREAILTTLDAAVRGEIPPRGPRGGERWTPRYFVRRLAWHDLDHVWEIEDRLG